MSFRLPYSDDPNHPDNWAYPSDDPPFRAEIKFCPNTTKKQAENAISKLRRMLGKNPKSAKIELAFVY